MSQSGLGDYSKLLPAFGAGIVVGYAAFRLLGGGGSKGSTSITAADVINPTIRKELPKVYDEIDVEDLGAKSNFCRCWRSKKFPFCDGTHNKFNAQTGDNVASLIVHKGRDKSQKEK